MTGLLDRVKKLAQLWLGLRIAKRILVFAPESNIKLPELNQFSTPQMLIDSLQKLVIAAVIRPRVAAGGRRLADMYELLKSTSACSSPEELARVIRECPITNSIELLGDNVAGYCSNCTTRRTREAARELETDDEEDENEAEIIHQVVAVNHLRVPNAQVTQSLFQDHQKFMFFFEGVAELFIQQRKDNPHEIRDFVRHLLSPDSRLRLSWRFLTVIMRSVLSTNSGVLIINELLMDIQCNQLTCDLNVNHQNLLRALLACADQDAQQNTEVEPAEDVVQVAAMTEEWTVDRIRRLASIRKQLTRNGIDATANIIVEWGHWQRNLNDRSVADSLLFFLLRFSSSEGDQTRLSHLFRHERVVEELGRYQVVGDFIRTLSPLALGFDLQSAAGRAIPFQERLLNGEDMGPGVFEHYPQLLQLQPNWGPFIARLAYHAADVFDAKNISLLREMSTNIVAAAQFFLPGIEDNPYLTDFNLQPLTCNRWFVCSCRTLNFVGDCGRPTPQSICTGCRVALAVIQHRPRDGVRNATIQDFPSPAGIHIPRTPSASPAFSVRGRSPIVTRLSLLLNSLALMNAALNPATDRNAIAQLLYSLPPAERRQNEDRRSLIELLANHITIHLDFLCRLLVPSRPQLNMTDKFRIGHLLLHKLLPFQDVGLLTNAANFRNGQEARETFENGLTTFISQQRNLAAELDNIAGQADQASRTFRQSLLNNETSRWAYAKLVFADRESVQLQLARNQQLRVRLPFLNMLMDDDNWMRKLNALKYLGNAMRFVALTRTVLQSQVTQEDANRMTIGDGLEMIINVVTEKAVILDRGRPIASRDHVMNLFQDFKQLWDRFSQLENAAKKTFLDYFECQQIDVNVRPNTVLDPAAPLILILAGSELPETTFSCQLLNHAIEVASSIALTDFIQPHCRAGSGRVRLSCSSAAALTDFDESLYAHVSTEDVDRFIRDHVIDHTTVQLAESFAMAAILGPAGSTIAEDLSLDVIPEFVFKIDTEAGNYLLTLERRSLAWQPTSIPTAIQELILSDLVRIVSFVVLIASFINFDFFKNTGEKPKFGRGSIGAHFGHHASSVQH